MRRVNEKFPKEETKTLHPLFGAIPYRTLPSIGIGPLSIRTFGITVAAGVILGAWIAARHAERHGIARETTYRLGMRMVLFGVVGARLTFVLSHLEELSSPLDVIAVWNGGLQFSGGFVAAVAAGYPEFRKWDPVARWHSLDGYALGLSVGLAFGRVACLSVGEHFGRATTFVLGVRYDGGDVQEHALGATQLQVGQVFHQTALYELLYLLAIFAGLRLVVRRGSAPGSAIAVFCVAYGACRFLSDTLRVNDERLLGLTGAQFLSITLVFTGASLWLRVRSSVNSAPTQEVTA